MVKLGAWVCSGLLALGCGGRAATDGAHDAEAGAGAGAGAGRGGAGGQGGGSGGASGGKASGGSSGTGMTEGPIGPWLGAPPPEGDGRLPDVPDAPVGEQGIGWDLCYADDALSGSDCADCASRGSDFLISEDSLEVSLEAQRPQVYFYFDPPQGAGALWFDVAWLDGPRAAELMFWETNTRCEPVSEGRLFDLSPLLTGERGAWTSGCISLDSARELSGVGLRLGAAGRVGLDAIRFGVPCGG